MSDEETIELLESKYREFAEAHGTAIERANSRAANRSHDQLIALVPKLRKLGKEGEAVFLRLMKDPSESVSCWAATHSLPIAESDALRVLDALAEKTGHVGLSAEMAAELWRNGELVIP